MFMNVGDATNSPQTLEKWCDKAKLVLLGAKEMAINNSLKNIQVSRP